MQTANHLDGLLDTTTSRLAASEIKTQLNDQCQSTKQYERIKQETLKSKKHNKELKTETKPLTPTTKLTKTSIKQQTNKKTFGNTKQDTLNSITQNDSDLFERSPVFVVVKAMLTALWSLWRQPLWNKASVPRSSRGLERGVGLPGFFFW